MTKTKLKLELARYRAFLVDLDGVLIRGQEPLPGAAEALQRLKELGRVIVFSNNSTRSRRAFAERLTQLGLALTPEEIVNSAYIAAQHLRGLAEAGAGAGSAQVYVIGEEGLREELELAGHRLVPPEEAEFLVVGLDRALTYEKLAGALRALLRGARFIATNVDPTLPAPGGLLPGAGAIVGAIQGMGFPPEVVVGKPSIIAFKVALATAGVSPEECLVIGDRLETDILGANRAGLDSVLVLTGVTKREDLERQERGEGKQDEKPTWIVESLPALVESL